MDKRLKKEDWLKIAALILLILGVMCFVGAMVSALDSAFEYAEDIVEKDPLEKRDFEDYFTVIMFTMSGIVSIVWSLVLFIISIIMTRKTMQGIVTNADTIVLSKSEYGISSTDENLEKRKLYCEYCRNEILQNERMCPTCGAIRDIEE